MSIVCCFLFQIPNGKAQQYRIESEYKLAIHDSLVPSVEAYLNDHFNDDSVMIQNDSLQLSRTTEVFVDHYFDTRDKQLLDQHIGLRHRLRYLDGELINELVQLKLPDSADGIRRREIKFEVPANQNLLDELSRDPILQFIDPSDRDLLSFHLKKGDVLIENIQESVKLTQTRHRIYCHDEKGSVATLTLDKLKQLHFPYHGFTELEIEINESRYTRASKSEAIYLEKINENLKSHVQNTFPDLVIDQTPKYNKLMAMVSNSLLSTLSDYFMWAIYAFIISLAGFKFITA